MNTDGWANFLTRLGTSLDAARATFFDVPATLTERQLSALYHHDDLSGLVCRIFPREALRRGLGFDDEDPVGKRLKDLGAREKLAEAASLGRAFGGAVVAVGIRGQASATPWTVPGEIAWLDVYDRRRITRDFGSRITDPESPHYGQPTVYRLQSPQGLGSVDWHRSRLLFFGGAETASEEREALDGWDYSVLQAIYPQLQAFNGAFMALGNMVSSASEGVMTIKGLFAAIAGGKRSEFEARMALIDSTRSVSRTVLLDADNGESYSKVATSFSGVPDTIDRFFQRLSMATGIPALVLARHVSAGIGDSTGGELRAWYDQVQGYRENEITPRLEQLLRMGWGDAAPPVKWPSLWQPTAAETADVQLKRAQRDQIYLAAEVVLPEEVSANVRDLYPSIDLSIREIVPDGEKEVETVDAPTVDVAARLAEEMTGAGLERCEHGRANRCPLCGVERDRGVLQDGTYKRGAWRAIPAS